MSNLKERIKEIIILDGPISVSQYMTLALTDPQFGYYQKQKPFGRAGDFITAPEISQLFGEMIGIWAIMSWQAQGCPNPFILAEIGPGRGTLMDDILRTIRKICITAFNAADIFLIEISQRLATEQKKRLFAHQKKIYSVENFEQIPLKPLIVIANELFDALPINQYVKVNGEWKERRITLNKEGGFTFTTDIHKFPSTFLPPQCAQMPNGTILEYGPSRNQLAQKISSRLMQTQGSALLIDYGASDFAFGDTLQAISRHKFCDIFSAPGEHDLTSHVDFFSLKTIAAQQGCFVEILEQGNFLIKMGVLERAEKLSINKSTIIKKKIYEDIKRLTDPRQMGKLFKVLHINDKNIQIPYF
ncbi:SAM-dependent methyltransferase, MidA family [Bartonella sp. CDC_skunk]|uniref:class I SAM-dependent methyltransferase n=1 Tax=unclassified Bartonella TaxID=2645622 RepID=UPI000999C1F5|nr:MULTISPECIES: class I SAM-dependent methyltransferase [unclassified Bartonella]AQX21743.1 SAM-dependent methyltransferase, MidA family [Bartonella sp. CDC_skunk]AQX27007.1 SAM-dependent methyltransferase, MidA family [Bartonella sp. Raccoon60]